MSNDWVTVSLRCPPEWRDVLIAELADKGYDLFQETDEGFITCMMAKKYVERDIDCLIKKYDFADATFTSHHVKRENWNQLWESNYEPVVVDDQVVVRAPFHPFQPDIPIDITLQPRMSFGTGHHETTRLMLQALLKMDLKGKYIADAGCGTGVLIILSGKLGATDLTAFDIDSWSVNNSQENFQKNNIQCHLLHGDIRVVDKSMKFDVLLANINKNVLLHDLPAFASHLAIHGKTVLSGFYSRDLPEITQQAERLGLHNSFSVEENGWIAVCFSKK